MNALRIRKRLDGPIPQLPELAPLIGKTVDIIVLEEESVAASGNGTPPKHGTIEELAAAQGVKPVTDLKQLAGAWPADERDDGFDEAFAEWRRVHVVPEFTEE